MRKRRKKVMKRRVLSTRSSGWKRKESNGKYRMRQAPGTKRPPRSGRAQ